MKTLWALAGLVTLMACTKDKGTGTPAPSVSSPPVATLGAPAVAAAPSVEVAAAPSSAPVVLADRLTSEVKFGPEGPIVVEPPVTLPAGAGGGDHAFVRGWASDSSELAFWTESVGTGSHDCGFLKPGGKVELLTDFDAVSGNLDETKGQAIKSRMDAKGYKSSAKVWLYAPEMKLTWKAVGTTGESPTAAGILRVGAQIAGEAEAVFPIYMEAKGVLGMHPEAIVISPNGKDLGVVSHGTGASGMNRFDLRVVSLKSFVGQTYNDTGFAHHKKGDYARAAELFHKAVAADPSHKLAAYNYACALAKLKHPATQAALLMAIATGGDKVKSRAAKDSDFADVKNEPWFSSIVN